MTLDVMGGTVQLLPNMAESTLLREQSVIQGADVVVVVAAADSGLPAAVAAMVHCPVIAVPTHAGFSATRTAQVAPASAHTNTCVAGMAVVRAPPLSLSSRDRSPSQGGGYVARVAPLASGAEGHQECEPVCELAIALRV